MTIEFIPYVPAGSDGITDELYEVANSAWIAQLGMLLDTSDEEFRSQLIRNTSLHTFVSGVLDAQLDRHPVDLEISKRIFLVFVRAGLVMNKPLAESSPMLAQPDWICRFAVVYGETNRDPVRKVIAQLGAADAIQQTLTMLMEDVLRALSGDLERLYVVARTVRVLVLVAKTVDKEWTEILFAAYDGPLLQQGVPSSELAVYHRIKYALVDTFDSLVDRLYFEPIKENREDAAEYLEMLSAQILAWIEKSGLEKARQAFTDAPLILDWEARHSISRKLQDINVQYFNGLDEQIEFLRLSMEQVRDMIIPEEKPVQEKRSLRNRRKKQPPVESDIPKTQEEKPIPDEVSVDMVAKVSQVQDIFPDLGEGFIEACLVANNNDAEVVIMQLLEDNLPPSVRDLDRSMKRQTEATTVKVETSLLDSRHNIFDNDEFDVLSRKVTVDRSKIFLGKKDHGTTESVLDDKSFMQEEKANILQRIYDMYDDEYDDTYDSINEVSGPVGLEDVQDDESAIDVVRRETKEVVDPGIIYESDLVHAFVENRQLFARTSAARKSPERAALRERTKMTDEQLEGWAIMLDKNPRKQRILDKYMLFDGQQQEVDPQVVKDQQQQSKQRRKGNMQPQSNSAESSARQRAYKDKNKARIANHNRKRGHDKKMSKAGVGGGDAR